MIVGQDNSAPKKQSMLAGLSKAEKEAKIKEL